MLVIYKQPVIQIHYKVHI